MQSTIQGRNAVTSDGNKGYDLVAIRDPGHWDSSFLAVFRHLGESVGQTWIQMAKCSQRPFQTVVADW